MAMAVAMAMAITTVMATNRPGILWGAIPWQLEWQEKTKRQMKRSYLSNMPPYTVDFVLLDPPPPGSKFLAKLSLHCAIVDVDFQDVFSIVL
jgi:hypothetical protein